MLLLRPKWVAGHLLALVLTGVFISAGFWQIARNREANHKLAHEKAVFAAPAPSVTTIDPALAARRGGRATATGTFDTAHDYLLRNQVRGSATGFDVLTPLRLSTGTAVLVDRGWVSIDTVVGGWHERNPPTGIVTVRGTLRPDTPLRAGETAKKESGVPSVPRADLALIARTTGAKLLPAYVVAEYQQPTPAKSAPQLPKPAKTTSVNHISYAIQWFSFAAIAVIGWPIVLRRATRRVH
ncbi:MAG: hypothetical protein JWL83_4653 [Actinomycetia bacterium]|jgi:cytochrome oxidase assembly protein ShyY1|nr:hypothetical protein [Actinomycetes bacterium]